ncbi:LOW QUALITY PROTEIN: complement C1q-like protein 2 [Cottoperca gobio]|uniref:LOW QUALITY PROTEIN: complement C1q-like protein 2 n=1 Tax=Cottoperca gobio TaxID=56716 RepID=A0A6J2RXW6_COTGO|nr:LOW QUALITY PROTEIN: complement C1q-like protein 2 [Cottoperca gobio]
MRSAKVFLPLLLCLHWTWAYSENEGLKQEVRAAHDQTYISAEMWAELKELRDMAIEHRTKIEKLEQQSTYMQLIHVSSSEKEVEELKERKQVNLLTRVTASENKSTVLEARMSSSEKEVEELKREKADRPKVAFSIGLTDAGQVGPFNTKITLKFSKVFTNVGQAYNPHTGIFTAPVRGAYYFKFSAWDNRSSWMGAELYHNDKRMTWIFHHNDRESYSSVSNAFVLQLEQGDVVYIVLSTGYGVYDAEYNLMNFSGFLLFAL